MADQRSLVAGLPSASVEFSVEAEDAGPDRSSWRLSREESKALASVDWEFEADDIGPDLVGVARALVFANSLNAQELDELERLASGERIRGLEFVFVHVFLERSRSRAAARAVLQWLVTNAATDPASSLGRWWEYNFGRRSGQMQRRIDLALAFVDVAEAPGATPAEREVVAKLYNVPALDAATCAALRDRIRGWNRD